VVDWLWSGVVECWRVDFVDGCSGQVVELVSARMVVVDWVNGLVAEWLRSFVAEWRNGQIVGE